MNLSFGLALSLHLLPGDWNEIHPYARLEHDSFGAGIFLNSEGNASLYAGFIGGNDTVWWEAGLATGYSGADVVPFGRAGVHLGDNTRAFIAPAYNVDTGSVGAVVGLEIDIVRRN